MPKCLKYGWFLPYTPSPYEYGSWKRHYIACVKTMDYVSADVSSIVVFVFYALALINQGHIVFALSVCPFGCKILTF